MTTITKTTANGAEVGVTLAPFAEGKRLYQACMSELRGIRIDGLFDVADLMKNIICASVASPSVDMALDACMKRCTYKGMAIKVDTFEPAEARADYTEVSAMILKENLRPFSNGLYAQFKDLLEVVASFQKLKS